MDVVVSNLHTHTILTTPTLRLPFKSALVLLQDVHGHTALHVACQNGHYKVQESICLTLTV